MSVGDNIRKRRYELKMSQQELADAMGYKTRSTIAKIESGENDVSQKKLQKFALFLDTTPEALISGFSNNQKFESKVLEDDKKRKNIVVILAGGKSNRNRQNIPSQFVNIHGKPILIYCTEIYQNHPAIDDIYIVCLKGWENIVKAYADEYGISKLRGVINSGNSGMLSLKNALDYIRNRYDEDSLIIVQEATRPMITEETVSHLIQVGIETGSGTICHSMNEYVQFDVLNNNTRYIDRNSVVALQSPEIHSLSIMKDVFDKAEKKQHLLTESCFTMLMYHFDYKINFIESNINNIKITREEDLMAFSVLMREKI